MKKILTLILVVMCLAGCKKQSNSRAYEQFKKKVNNSESYKIKGSMEIYNNDETYTYSIDVSYKKDDLYKVTMINQSNNHEQVIIKNNDGVYVVTPALNKSFKFQSEWPNNGSQAYLLDSIVKDCNKDPIIKTENKETIVTCTPNYPNNPDLVKENIYLDKHGNVTKLVVINKDNQNKIKVLFKDTDYNASIRKEEFTLDSVLDESKVKTEKSGQMEDAIYPLFIPTNTYLSNKETLETDSGKRNILTFNGEKNFTLIEETTLINDDLSIIPVYGDPLLINDTIGALGTNYLYWTNNDIDYYLSSSDISQNDLITIAKSIGNTVLVGK